MSDAHRLFADLESTLTNGAGQQRFTILRKITDLFLAEVDYYSDDHVAVFDQLMSRLIDRIERQALVELSGKLAPVGRAPANVIGLLSNNDDIDVAGPVLAQSGILTDEELVAIAESKSQAHLDAIAGRSRVNEPITDVLIDRGNAEVAHKITANPGARFSRFGFSTAMTRAEDDDSLAMAVAARLDLPDDLLEQLVGKASMTVQQRLLANARPEMRQDPARLRARIVECAESRNLPELLDALAVLSEIPVKAIKDIARQGSNEAVLVLRKSCGFRWHDLQKIMAVLVPSKKTPDEVNALFASYTALSTANAQRAVRFIQTSRSRLADEMRKLMAVAAT